MPAPSTPDLIASSDTGVSNTDNVTADNTPTVTGTADPGATVQILDGTTVVGTGVADQTGVYTITTSPLADGVRALSARAAFAGAETRANTFTANAQNDPAVAALAGGGHVVVWASDFQDGSGRGVYGQRYAAGGAPVGSEFRVNSATANDEFDPAVVGLPGGGFVVAYTFGGRVALQRFSAVGGADGPPVLAGFISRQPALTALDSGGYVVTYTDSSNIEAQRYTSAGASDGAKIDVAIGGNSRSDSSVAALAGGGFVVTWTSGGQDGDGTGVYGLRYDAAGAAQGAEFRVNSFTAGAQEASSVAGLPGGGFVVTWQSVSQDGAGFGIYAQRYDASGAAVGLEFRVNTQTQADQTQPSVSALAGGGFVITWTSRSQDNPGSEGVYAQRYTDAGVRVGGETLVNVTTAGNQNSSAVAGVADGRFVVAYQSPDGAGEGVFSRLLGDQTSAALNVTIDTRPSTPDLVAASDTGASNTDNVTADNTPTLTGTAAPDATVTILDGTTVVGTGVADGAGAYSITTSALADGVRSLTARSTSGGPETQANTFTALGQNDPAVAALAGGGHVVVWTSFGQDGSGRGVYGQRYGAGGAPVGVEFRVNSTNNDEFDPAVVGLPGGGFVVAYSVGQGLLVLQRFTAAGAADGPPLSAAVFDVSQPALTALESGGYVLTYTQAGSIVAARFTAAGAQEGAAFRVTNPDGFGKSDSAVAALAGGGFVVTWTSNGQDGSSGGVYGRRYDAAGAALGAEFRVNTTTANSQLASSVAGLPGGGFVVTWESFQDGDIYGIYAQRYDASGAAVGGEFRVNTQTLGNQSQSSVAVLAGGGFVVTWTSTNQDGTGAGNGVYSQRYTDAGAAVGGETLVNVTTQGDQDSSAVAGLAGGGYVVAFQSPDAQNEGVFTRLFTDQTSAPLNVTIDTAAPAAPAFTSFADDTGAAGDGLTRDNTPTFTGAAEANSTVTILRDGAAVGTATANGAGVFTFTSAALADGAYSFTAMATDAAGNVGAASAAFVLRIDTVAPAAPTLTGFTDDTGAAGDGRTSDATPTITGTAEANSIVTILLNGVAVGTVTASAAGAFSFTSAALADGTYSFTATARDAAGATGAVSNALTVTVDATAPAAPTITGFADDTGATGDGRTADTTPTLTGTAEANATVTILRDGVVVGTTTAGVTGAFSFTSAPLADGAYAFTARATDAAGNVGATSAALTVTVDATAPAAPTITGFADDTGAAGDGRTADTTPTITGTAEANATVTILRDGVVVGTTTAGATGAFSFTSAALADGTYGFTARATDAAGNVGATSAALTVTVDATAPAAPTLLAFTDDTGLPGDGRTADTTPTLTGTAEAGSTVTILRNGVVVGTTTAGAAGAFSFTSAALADGNYSFTARATDAAGNVGAASAPLPVTVDTSPTGTPTITGFSDDTGTAGDGRTADTTPTITGTAEAGSTVTVLRDGVVVGTTTAGVTGGFSFTSAALADGTYGFTVRAADAAGNVSATSAPLTVTVDTAAPAAPTITGFADDTGAAGDGRTADTTPTITGTAEAGSTVAILRNGVVVGTTTAGATGAFSFTSAALADGTYSFTARVADAAGNAGPTSAALTVTVDTAPPAAPVITGFADDTGVPGDRVTADTTPTISGSAEANATVTVLRNGVVVGTTTANAAGAFSFTSAVLADGTYSFTARVTDAAGNTGATSAPFTLTVANLNDLLIGGPGPDFLAGGAGNDTILGAGGNDTLTGGADNDVLDGQDGLDTADYGDSPNGVTVSLALQGVPQATGFGNDTLVSIENLRGSEFNDRLTGDEGDNILLGLGGADTLTGAGGNDQIAGGAGADSIDGGTGADRLFGQDGADTVAGGEGDDVLFGGADGDSLSGGAGADSLNGEAGNDTLDGGAGLDVLSGELGADLLNGGDDGDQLYGGADGDQLNGGAGGDVLNGEGGADTLNGGDQDDTLSGEDGADILVGGRGADVLIGGTGADRFAWLDAGDSTVNGRDLVFDFTSGSDVLDLSLVDANTLLAGDQAFVLANSFQAGQAGRLVVTRDESTGRVLVVGDTDGDGLGDFGFVVGGLFTGPAGPGVIALSTFAPGDLIL